MEQGLDKQKLIIDSARQLFCEFGYKRVSMDEIAASAGVAKGTLYLYFKDKNELFNYFVNEEIQNIKAITKKISEENLPFFEEIHKAIYEMLMYRKNLKFLSTITKEAKALKTNSVCESVKKLDNEALCYIESLLTRGIECGDIKPCNIKILSFLIFHAYIALAFEWEEEHEALSEDEISKNIILLFKTGL